MDLKYEIALCSVWWKKGDIDNRLFDSINEQKAYFDNKITYWSPLSNFPLNDNSVTTISFKDLSSRSVEEVIENNYAVVKKTIDGVETYRYYFAHLFQDSGRVFVCDLELDNIQTNYISIRNSLNPCFIRRATIDRFKTDGYFNLEPDSKMFIPEGTSHQQRLIKRERLKIKFTGTNVIDTWLNDNIAGWLYLYIDNSSEINVGAIDRENYYTSVKSELNLKYENEVYNAPYGVMCAPIYKAGARIKITDINSTLGSTFTLSTDGLYEIASQNSYLTSSKGYGLKYSIIPPFTYGTFESGNINYEVDIYGNLIIKGSLLVVDGIYKGILTSYSGSQQLTYNDYGGLFCRPRDVLAPLYGCICDVTHIRPTYNFELDLSTLYELNPNPVGALRNKKFNPKLLNGDYRKLRIVCENSYYEYFVDKLNSTNIILGRYSENILIGQNKCYVRLAGGLYDNSTLSNYTGCIANYDATLPLLKDKWDEFIANNKNYFLQTGISYTLGLVKSGFNMVGQNYLKAMGGALDSWESMAQAIINKDNMENAPQSLCNVSGDPIFILQAHDLGAYFEYYECLDYEMEIDNDYMYFNGYQVNTYGRIQDIDHLRKYFDYIQAEIDVIPINISNDEKKGLSQIFRQGIRLWHTDNFEGYTYENYERSLE